MAWRGDLLIRIKYPGMGSSLSEILRAVVAGWYEQRLPQAVPVMIQEKLLRSGAEDPDDYFPPLGHMDGLITISSIACRTRSSRVQQKASPEEVGYGLHKVGWHSCQIFEGCRLVWSEMCSVGSTLC